MAISIRLLLFVVGVFISTSALGEQLGNNLLQALELSENRDTLLKYNGNRRILDLSKYDELSNIQVIGREAFANNLYITEVTLPRHVHVIGNGAFAGCKKLTKVNMPDTVNHIGASAFWECDKLKMSELPKELKSIDENAFVKCI